MEARHMLRSLALVLLPLALLAAACGGSSSEDGVNRYTDEEPVTAASDAGGDGIYGTEDDAVIGEVQDPDESSEPSIAIDADEVDGSTGNSSNGPATYPDGDSFPGDASGSSDDGGGFGDNAVFGALNPFSFLGGPGLPPASQPIDSELGSALLIDPDIPSEFSLMGEFSFAAPSEFGDMDMAARMWGIGLESDEFGAMIMSAAMVLPPEAMGEIDELIGMTEADLAEMQSASQDFGMEFAKIELLDVDGLGEGGFGMHMELDFGAFFSAFGAPEEDEGPAGIAMDMYAFVVGDRVLMVIVMWPMGESLGVDGRSLAEIMASRA
jgi:hypothetical protein